MPKAFTPEQKRTKLAIALTALRDGATHHQAATRAGVCAGTLYAWRRQEKLSAEEPPAFRPVALVPTASPATALVLVAPSGHRLEGISLADAARLLGLPC